MEVLLLCLLLDASALKDFLEAAEKNNIDRQISREHKVVAERRLRQDWIRLLPVVSASGGYTYNQVEAIVPVPDPTQGVTLVTNPNGTQTGMFNSIQQVRIQVHNQFGGTLGATLPLVDVSRWMKIAQASAALDAATARDTANRDLMRKAVVTTYYSYLAATAVTQSAERAHAVAKSQAALQTARAAAGTVTQLDKLRADAEVEARAQLLADSQSLAAQTRRALRTLTGLEPDDNIPMPPENQSLEAPYRVLEKRAPDVPAVRAAYKSAINSDRIASVTGYRLLPTLNAQFTEYITNASSFAGVAAQYTVGVSLNWRLDVQDAFEWSAQRAEAVTARLEAEKARLAAVDAIHNDWQRFHAAVTKVKAARAQVDAARRASEVAHNRYLAGATGQIEVISAERDLLSAEVAQIQASAELAMARLSLRISAALPLDP